MSGVAAVGDIEHDYSKSMRWAAATVVAAVGASIFSPSSSSCEQPVDPATSDSGPSLGKVTRFMDWLKEQGADMGGVEVRLSKVGLHRFNEGW